MVESEGVAESKKVKKIQREPPWAESIGCLGERFPLTGGCVNGTVTVTQH